MQVNRADKDDTTIVMVITAHEAEMDPIRQHVLSHFVNEVNIPGFRQGKAPLELVEKRVDQQRFMDEFMEHAVNQFYNQAVIDQALRVLLPPQIEVKKFVPFTLLEFEATVSIANIKKIADYKKIKIEKPKASVTAKDVEDVIKSLQLRAAERTATDQPAKRGNEVVIDFDGKDPAGKPIAGASGKDFPLILGSKTFIPGFEEELAGLKVGDEKEFLITFPKDYGVAALRGKKANFKVTVKAVNVLYQTAADDAFVTKVSPFKTMAELKADIKKQLQTERQNQSDRELESRIVNQIVEKSELVIPKQLIEEQVLRMEEDEKRNLLARGTTWEEHLKEEGINVEQHRDRHRPDAERNIKAGILLGEITERENINVTPEELAIRIQLLKGQTNDPTVQAQLDDPQNQRDIRARLLTEKVLEKLRFYAAK